MEEKSPLSQLQREIQHDFPDIKAESILAMAVDGGFREEDFVVAAESLFKRPYSRDVLDTVLEDGAGNRDFLQLHISRDGLHDLVPGGLFYQPVESTIREADAAGMAADHRSNKRKERETRRFFMPFENAFFSQRIHLEMEETRLLEGMGSGLLNEYFREFWDISTSIPFGYVTSLMGLLPHATKIAGNLSLTAQCLEKILEEKVTLNIIPVATHQASLEYCTDLGLGKMGMDTVLGGQFFEDFPQIEVSIGPLQNSEIQDYLEMGDKEDFLKTFYGYFLPAEAEINTVLKVGSENQHMYLYPGEGPVLGYSSVLGNERFIGFSKAYKK